MSFFDRLKQKNVLPKKTLPVKKDVSGAQKEESAEAHVLKKVNPTGEAYRILVKPLLSEKAVSREEKGVYTFVVKTEANKEMVKEAVRRVYGVAPVKVRIMNAEGKWKKFGRRSGRRSDWKKAIVTLPKGKTISVHEGV